jgi:hypothetical protein
MCVRVELTKRPVEGFSAGLLEDDNIFEVWRSLSMAATERRSLLVVLCLFPVANTDPLSSSILLVVCVA